MSMDKNCVLSHNKFDIRIFFVLLIASLNILLTMFQFQLYNGCVSFCDFAGQWKLCAYALQGIDPYPLIGANHALIDSVGTIPKGWGTSPWGLLLGNIFYPGFLSFDNAKKYFVLINLFLLCVTALCVSRKLNMMSKRFSWYSFVCSLFSFWSVYSIEQGNAGCGICCLLMLVVLFHETSPIFSGFLLGLAMVKPQISLIFCVALLFIRSYRVVITSFLVVLVSLLAISGIVHNNPVSLIYEFLNAGIGNNQNYAGIFTLLFMNNKFFAMILSMLTGTVLVSVLTYCLPKNMFKPLYFFPACLVGTFWCYSFYNEFYILLLPLLVSNLLILNAGGNLATIAAFLSSLYITVGSFILVYFPSVFFDLFDILTIPILVTNDVWINMWIARTAFEIGIIFILFVLIFLLNKHYKYCSYS